MVDTVVLDSSLSFNRAMPKSKFSVRKNSYQRKALWVLWYLLYTRLHNPQVRYDGGRKEGIIP